MRAPLVVILVLLCLTGCGEPREENYKHAAALTGGDPGKGKTAINMYGCASCHTIPGIHGADSLVGPPLTSIAQRTYLAGVIQNNPENLVRWLRNPPKIDSRTAMPNMHLSDADARDIASYLYTLR
jgi:cytochrome c